MNVQRTVVLDTFPAIAYLQGESAAESVIEIIADAHEQGNPLLMSAVNAGEVWYIVAQRSGPDQADDAIALLRTLGIKIVDVDWTTTRIAAAYKARGGISYADCFAAALARKQHAHLVTGDPEFRKLEREIEVVWLGREKSEV